ncbi:MAG: Glu/Leu/Phe/Val dehydrogenase [Calditrichaeota bacterium]|nr:MAG: Glu/Leu/Phe/Val dehydrogenase [Calditrichota bacterium]
MSQGSTQNPFQLAQEQLDRAAGIMKLDPGIHAVLREPSRELHVSIPVRMDDGSVRVFKGFRVQYNDARGPCKGGIRFHPEETIDTVRALAAWMTWKTAVVNIPLGGGKGGVICNPKEMSPGELERLSRGYIDQVGRILGPEKDIPAPDVYTNPQIMAWMADEYAKLRGHYVPGVITGKPIEIGGSEGRGDATARGAYYTIREACKKLKLDLKQATFAVQGFGNAGQHIATILSEAGARLVAVSDSKGGVLNRDGLDAAALIAHKRQTGTVADFPGADKISNEELLVLDVDIMCPSALENQFTHENADQVKAKIVAELANGPTTLEADEIFHRKGVFVIPDFLCNAGGVTVSYFEVVQNLYNFYWDLQKVHQMLDRKMTDAFWAVDQAAEKYRVDPRMAAYVVALDRVANAIRLRGIV